MANTASASSGLGLGGVIFVVLLVLKLAEVGVVATWSWWWVTAPLWIPFGIFAGVIAVVGLVALFVGGIDAITSGLKSRKRLKAMMSK